MLKMAENALMTDKSNYR